MPKPAFDPHALSYRAKLDLDINREEHGAILMELMICLVLMALSAMIVVGDLPELQGAAVTKSVQRRLVQFIEKARLMAIVSECTVFLKLESDRLLLEFDDSCTASSSPVSQHLESELAHIEQAGGARFYSSGASSPFSLTFQIKERRCQLKHSLRGRTVIFCEES